MDRKTLLSLTDAALTVGASTFARDASRGWLGQWPGDFRVRSVLAQAYGQLHDLGAALRHVQIAQVADPEEIGFYRLASEIQSTLGQEEAAGDSLGWAYALAADPAACPHPLPSWSEVMRHALAEVLAHNYTQAQGMVEEVERARPNALLPLWLQLKIAWLAGDYEAVLRMGAAIRQRWPGCPAILLALAQASLAMGKSTQAVELLHLAAVADPAHEVAARMLGAFNPYLALWPAQLQADIRTSIPSQVAFAAGLNKLTASTSASGVDDGRAEPETVQASHTPAPPGEGSASDVQPEGEATAICPLPGEHFQGPSAGDSSAREPVAQVNFASTPSGDAVPVQILPLPGEHFQGPTGGLSAIPAEATPTSEPAPPSPPSPAETQGPGAKDAELEQVRAELHRVARRLHMRPKLGENGQRRPTLVVLTSLLNLQSRYGAGTTAQVRQCLAGVIRSQRSHKGWSAYAIYVDDAESLSPFQLEGVDASNAAAVKRLVIQLRTELEKHGEMISALLIVGGHDIIPFHRLPNPADDDDQDVPSDSPYATSDDNYFVPEWAVSRLPTPNGNDPQFLLGALGRIITSATTRPPTSWARLIRWIGLLFHPRARRFRKSLGYTASIWHSASLGAYRPIGQANSLLVSPPMDADTLPVRDLAFPRYSYFNLHGLEEAPDWFGQRSPDSDPSLVEFPTALRPAQVTNSGRAPEIVFSEACYGANVLGKAIDSVLALKFLESGTRALVGSTKIAYGAAAPPLIGADLVALHYWQNLLRGIPSGEALRQAKLSFAEEMRRRQGYLDGEDQKTLISFVHLGDPLCVPEEFNHLSAAKAAGQTAPRPAPLDMLEIKRVEATSLASLPPDLETSLKQVLQSSLPSMTDCRKRFFETQITPGGSAGVPEDTGDPAKAGGLPAWVIALDKRFEGHNAGHAQYARLSLDATGRLIKLLVSR